MISTTVVATLSALSCDTRISCVNIAKLCFDKGCDPEYVK